MIKQFILGVFSLMLCSGVLASKENDRSSPWQKPSHSKPLKMCNVSLGPRPAFLIEDMDNSPLKQKLHKCAKQRPRKSDFSIGHRGAPMQFPEHTKESYVAAAQMGAGILECDVTFTKDKELVCRHSQCDLHTTTNILLTPLAEKCSEGFTPAVYDESGNLISPASAKCCTSDITLAEFKSLTGKMDAADSGAQSIEEYLNATANWRTDLYSSKGTLLSHKESIELFKSLGTKMTPELKSPSVTMPFDGFSQQDYAQKLVDEYNEANVPAKNVWAQSFNYDDILYWINNTPRFGSQAVFLDGRYDLDGFDHRDPTTWEPSMEKIIEDGGNYIAPPMWMLVESIDGKVVPSEYAKQAKSAGLNIITWTFERSGPLASGGGWYYQTLNGQNTLPGEQSVIDNDGDMYDVLHVLAKDVGIKGIFSDWPATVTYYANCMGL